MNKAWLGVGVALISLLLLVGVGTSVLAGGGALFWLRSSAAPPPDAVSVPPAPPSDAPPAPLSSSSSPTKTPSSAPAVGGGGGSGGEGGAIAAEGTGTAGSATGPSSGQAKSSACADTISGVTRHSATHFTLSQSFVDTYIRDQGKAQQQGTAGWRKNKKKKTVGLRVSGLKCAPKVAGLKNGDVIRAVDGRELTSSTAAIMAYNSALNSKRFVVELRRDGAAMTIRYDVE